MKIIWVLLLLILVFICWPREVYIATPGCKNPYNPTYIQNIREQANVNILVMAINIPFSTINPVATSGGPVKSKWEIIFRSAFAASFSLNPGYSHITPLNVVIGDYQPTPNGGTLIYINVSEEDPDGYGSVYMTIAAYNLFLPNLRTSMYDPIAFFQSGAGPTGCPASETSAGGSCTATSNVNGVICTPNIGCRDNGILSENISRYIYGDSAPQIDIKCYWNAFPS
jgi:hypothetical protein